MKLTTESIELGGKTLTLEHGRFAEQASGAILATYGETVVLVTVAVSSRDSDLDYFPLHVEFAEKLYAGGKIKGSRWVKREGKPTEDATLKARVIDRSIRPLFPKSFKREVQVIATVLSVDGVNDPDIPAVIATSAALSISEIPWDGPVAGVRIGLTDKLIINPANGDRDKSTLDLIVSGTTDAIVMVEAGAYEVTESQTIQALELAHTEIQKICSAIASLTSKIGKPKLEVKSTEELDKALVGKIAKDAEKELAPRIGQPELDKHLVDDIADTLLAKYEEEIDYKDLHSIISDTLKQMARSSTIEKGIRIDGRKLDEIREISAEVGVLPRVHGSAMFKRGNTQALSVVTLGSPADSQLIEYMDSEETKRYIHHYYMPPFSVGETGRIGWPSRREIGHGALGERALIAVIPSEIDFPYTIRVVSELMSSNGSTSQAAICGSTLSLMHAGVPIKKPVAGIAMGLMKDGEKTAVLSDIRGEEDHIGDMDFKVAGTKDGITALQMDIKIKGISFEVLTTALEQARVGRLEILDHMLKAIDKPSPTLSQYAPKLEQFEIPTDKIGEVIGPGGKMIKQIMAETGAEINIDDSTGKGIVTITSADKDAISSASTWIKNMVKVPEPGEVYEGKVKRVEAYGAFVEILPGKTGLVHVSKMSKDFVDDPSKLVKEGDIVTVKVLEMDKQGRLNLTMV